MDERFKSIGKRLRHTLKQWAWCRKTGVRMSPLIWARWALFG
jgi:hypothetical protein